MKKYIMIFIIPLLLFSQCYKPYHPTFNIENGIYDWEYSQHNGLITPDSTIDNYSIEIFLPKITFYKNNIKVFKGEIKSVLHDYLFSGTCSNSYYYRVNASGTTFYIQYCYLSADEFVINNFPYGSFNTNLNNSNLDPNRFYKPEFSGYNKFLKRQ